MNASQIFPLSSLSVRCWRGFRRDGAAPLQNGQGRGGWPRVKMKQAIALLPIPGRVLRAHHDAGFGDARQHVQDHRHL